MIDIHLIANAVFAATLVRLTYAYDADPSLYDAAPDMVPLLIMVVVAVTVYNSVMVWLKYVRQHIHPDT